MAEKLGPYLNIDKYIGKAKDRINKVGVELEGGWKTAPNGRAPDRDGSVHLGPGDDPQKVLQIAHIGEIPLPALGMKEWPAAMKLYYPFLVNHTCGMHVHLSTKGEFAYQRLMVNRPFSFPATVVEYISRWAVKEKLPPHHPIWPRLKGENEFCQHVFQAEEQVKTINKDFDHHRVGHRYSVIGYCWSRWKTLECRLLPMMDTPAQGIRAVQAVIDITNGFLAASKEKEQKHITAVSDSDDYCPEERKIYV